MVIRTDLRIDKDGGVPPGGKKIMNTLISASVALAFISAAFFFAGGVLHLLRCKKERAALSASLSASAASLEAVKKELAKIKRLEDAYSSDLDFVLSDIPSVEFLHSVSGLIQTGVSINGIAMTPDCASVSGTAASRALVLDFAKKIERCAAVSRAEPPKTDGLNASGAGCGFTIGVSLKKLPDVLKAARGGPVTGGAPEGASAAHGRAAGR